MTLTAADYPPVDPPVTTDEHYFTLDELRLEQDIPEASYPDEVVEPNRDLAEQVLEHSCGVAFIPRRRTEQLHLMAAGLYRLSAQLVRELEAITVDGIDLTTEQLDGIGWYGDYLAGAPWTPSQVVVAVYTHGYDEPPARVRRAAMIATRVWTTRGPVDDRATQVAADGATVNLATPGVRGSVTGIPEVDVTIGSFWRPGRLF